MLDDAALALEEIKPEDWIRTEVPVRVCCSIPSPAEFFFNIVWS